ncbi:DoxX family protein [Mucilaginibacter boryungensis]|uniref:DoxX family protein n=1 Tax=Mucilaginibacter boryungensis TaxID=768480 RepID=A0ABR9XNK1_9SPHI|nr:DoxX family protein [Mucilaginibacter boryungensis]MBE9668709.1 DoxX family protein [Mucilaginibacter boryungensis]
MAIFGNLGNYRNFGLLIIRVGLGLMFIFHGLPKLEGGVKSWETIGSAMGSAGIHFFPVFWGLASAVVETVGGFLLILGLAFRPVCLLLVIDLVVAALFHFHKGEGLMGASHAIEDAIMFAGLLFVGPGKYSVDKK